MFATSATIVGLYAGLSIMSPDWASLAIAIHLTGGVLGWLGGPNRRWGASESWLLSGVIPHVAAEPVGSASIDIEPEPAKASILKHVEIKEHFMVVHFTLDTRVNKSKEPEFMVYGSGTLTSGTIDAGYWLQWEPIVPDSPAGERLEELTDLDNEVLNHWAC